MINAKETVFDELREIRIEFFLSIEYNYIACFFIKTIQCKIIRSQIAKILDPQSNHNNNFTMKYLIHFNETFLNANTYKIYKKGKKNSIRSLIKIVGFNDRYKFHSKRITQECHELARIILFFSHDNLQIKLIKKSNEYK